MSKSRFHEVRREQLPRSYSPPPTPPVARDVLPLSVLPFPAIVPPSTEGPTLKRSASFHPGGSQRLRREALVIDGKVTIDTGFKLRSRSLESISSSASEPNNTELVVRQLNSGHQSGLERLKNSMLRLMKTQSRWRRLAETEGGVRSEPPFGRNMVTGTTTEGVSHQPLAVRRGQPVPLALKLVPTRPPPLVSPYSPDILIPLYGSSSAGAPVSEVAGFLPASGADKRESIGVEDMCSNLRCLVSPIILSSAGKEDISPSKSYCPTTDPAEALENAVGETPQTLVEEWNFASELKCAYGEDPFSYFDSQERMPSFIRPLSITPDIVTERTETQQSFGSVISVSTFPEPPTGALISPSVPHIMISGEEPVPDFPSAQTRSTFSFSATMDPTDGNEMPARTTVSSTGKSPRSSEDKDEPLAIRRLTLLARSSTAMIKVEEFSAAGNFPSLVQGSSESTPKIVRFASEIEEHTSFGDSQATCSPCVRQRPRSSSVPPPQKGSFRNKTFLQLDSCKRERLSRSQPTTLPSGIPKKHTSGRISVYGQHLATKDPLASVELGNGNEGRKRLSSMIPVAGLKAPQVPFSLNHEKGSNGKRAIGRSSRLDLSMKQPSRIPTPQSAQPQQKSPIATGWPMTLRQYVKGGDPSGEKQEISHSQSQRRRGELKVPSSLSVGTKSLLPVKKTSFFRDGLSKATRLSEAQNRTEGHGRTVGSGDDSGEIVIGSVDKTGGISYIAPPKVREKSRSPRGVLVKGDREACPSVTTATRTLKPVQIRNFLGRFAA